MSADAEYKVVLSRPQYTAVRDTTPTKIVSRDTQGPQGPAGGTTTTIINIVEPTLTWTLAHYLGRYPSVTVYDTAGDLLVLTPKYVDSNIIVLSFTVPTSGYAYLN